MQNASKVGFDKLYLDYIRKPTKRNDLRDEVVLRKQYENDRKFKNAVIYSLTVFREKNKKPSINEILQDVIMKDKAQRKAEKMKLMQLMKSNEEEEN